MDLGDSEPKRDKQGEGSGFLEKSEVEIHEILKIDDRDLPYIKKSFAEWAAQWK